MRVEFGLRFHHFGLAVKKLAPALSFLTALGYAEVRRASDPLQHVDLVMCSHCDMPDVEIVFPTLNATSPIDTILSRRPEGIIYHLCYETGDVPGSLASIEAAGSHVVQVVAPKPAVLFGGREVSFYMVDGVGLIELLASDD